MPRSGVPYRAYFMTHTHVAWFDATAEGERTWSRANRIQDVWRGLVGLLPDHFGVPSDMLRGAYPVASETLRVIGGSDGFLWATHVDVARGTLVPDPRTFRNIWDNLHAPTWDIGPIALFRHPDQTASLIDLRDNSEGPSMQFTLDTTRPMIALPGEPLRWFTEDSPPRVTFNNGVTLATQPAATVFPGLPLTDQIVETTLVYGACRSVLSDATAALSDEDVRAVAVCAQSLGVNTEGLLAALCLLSGLRPTGYHPQGHYGIAQMTADQLSSGGWADAPTAILEAPVGRQLSVLTSYFATLPAHADAVWPLGVLLTGQPLDSLDDASVVARAPYSARMSGFAPVAPDGTVGDSITVGDLRRAVNGLLTGPMEWELHNRAGQTSLA